ncbi:hypothetical protein [Flexivirga alba]|uniref:Uncharacterized protein n=1 Tax=Flexivirga alba TaxID=702742 RepID=A0ABW2AEY4_9MICO
MPTEATDKPLAGLSGKLLPHGSQLPAGLTYRGAYSYDYKKTWPTSLADGYENAVPVTGLIGADQSLNGPTNAQIRAAYGTVSGVTDMAANSHADTDPRFKSVMSTIVRFRTPTFAQSAIAKAQRKQGGMYWIRPTLTRANVAWSGVTGVTGDHGVYTFATGVGPQDYVAYQVVGEYIVSADSQSAASAEQAVTDMVGNLRTAGLLP